MLVEAVHAAVAVAAHHHLELRCGLHVNGDADVERDRVLAAELLLAPVDDRLE